MSHFVSGRHFLHTPGPTNLPDRVLRAMDRNAINHRGPEFGALGREVIQKLRPVFGTEGVIGIFPASGTGAWEAALVNTLKEGDRVLISRTGQFSHLWEQMATRFGLDVVALDTDWRRGADPLAMGQVLADDREHRIKAVFVVHSETSTSCMSDVGAVRAAMDRARHPALLMVDAISSLGCTEYKHDAWGVDVTIAGSQKGLMVPPGLSFTAISDKALAAARAGGSRRSYWDWEPLVTANKTGFFPYTSDEPAVGAARIAGDDAGGRAGYRLCPPPALCRGHPSGRRGLGAGAAMPRPQRLWPRCHRGARAGRAQRG
jgi:alanine-glyoxylate transaminase/serine-glyoxylate transaminase/serine-pyruvate transaminase